MQRTPLILMLGLLSLTIQACSLPQGAGLASQVLEGAEEPDADFSVHFVTSATLASVASWPTMPDPNAVGGWIGRAEGGAGSVIEPGDVITLLVWSNETDSLLAAPGQRQIAFPPATVAPDGSIFLPYADKVRLAGLSPEAAREAVQRGLSGVIPSAQVQLSVTPGRRNVVELVSGVARPGPYPLPDTSFGILSLIAQGGGVPASLVNPQVRLTRGDAVHGIALDRLLADPRLDTTLRGGDKVFVDEDKRYFLSLGAAGIEAQQRFVQPSLTALDAMSLIGGLNDASADPRGILILREYPASALRADGKGPDRRRMIFAFDVTSADGLFSAGGFQVQHRDLVLITESPIVSARSAISVIGAALGLVNAGQDL